LRLLALVLAACVPLALPTPASARPQLAVRAPRVLIFGDSIIVSAAPRMAAELRSHAIFVRDDSLGGTSPCDEVPRVAEDISTSQPDVVVIAYVGNGITPCMAGAPDIVGKHFWDTLQLIRLVNRPVVLATPPGPLGERLATPYRTMLKVVQRVTGPRTLVADTATALVNPKDGRFDLRMPCTTGEHCRSIAVRGHDRFHLSKAGAARYARFLSKELFSLLESTRAALASCRSADPAIVTPTTVPFVDTFLECASRSLIPRVEYQQVLAAAASARFIDVPVSRTAPSAAAEPGTSS
jgi:lysophospholipase L1-like esterase